MHAIIGRYMLSKTRRLAAAKGVERTARNLRKQGVPLAIALALLVGRV